MINREFQHLGELPDGYEYKLYKAHGQVIITGISPDKSPVGFMINADNQFIEVDVS